MVNDSIASLCLLHEISQTGDLGLRKSMTKLMAGGIRKNPIATLQDKLAPVKYVKRFKKIAYTANAYRQTTDKLMFKSVISAVR